MKYVEAGGARLSAIGLGTWQFGSGEWGYGTTYAQSTAPLIVNRALDLGINLIDTAEIYGFGRSETICGRALQGQRDRAFIATKLFPLVPLDGVIPARARGSMRRLEVEVLDLYQVHWPNPVVPIGVTMRALGALQRHGAVRHLGVSNFSLAQWQAAEHSIGTPVLSNQVRYSLLDRRAERELLPWAQANDRVVIAYSPLSQGLLSGRYDAGHLPGGMRASTPAFLPENLERSAPVIAVLRDVAKSHDATCSQVALAWLLRRPNVVVIPGASSVDQVAANAAAAELDLSDDEDRALYEASDQYRPIGGAAALPRIARARAGRLLDRFQRVRGGLEA